MRYIKANLSNGWCGHDEEFLMEFPDTATDDAITEDVINSYSYIDGSAELDPYNEEEYEDYEDYLDEIYFNSDWEEISEEEFTMLRDEQGWEVR